jgi:hypothetical protein
LKTRTLQSMPLYFLGNPRATKLQDKDLLKEFAWYRSQANALAHFAEAMHRAFRKRLAGKKVVARKLPAPWHAQKIPAMWKEATGPSTRLRLCAETGLIWY